MVGCGVWGFTVVYVEIEINNRMQGGTSRYRIR
jgi:hypothetical protein